MLATEASGIWRTLQRSRALSRSSRTSSATTSWPGPSSNCHQHMLVPYSGSELLDFRRKLCNQLVDLFRRDWLPIVETCAIATSSMRSLREMQRLLLIQAAGDRWYEAQGSYWKVKVYVLGPSEDFLFNLVDERMCDPSTLKVAEPIDKTKANR